MDYNYQSAGIHPPASATLPSLPPHPPPASMMMMSDAHPPMSYPQHHSVSYFAQQAVRDPPMMMMITHPPPMMMITHPPPPPPPRMMMMSCTRHQLHRLHQFLTYLVQQVIRAGYVAPHFENRLGHIQNQPANMREAIQREIEKERIKEEIIAEEIARRRMLELEVRRELMMERQLAQQSGEGLSPFSSPVMSFSPTLPVLNQQSVVRSVEERIARSSEDRTGRGIPVSRLGARNEIGRLEIIPFEERISEIPFQQRSVEPQISTLEPVFRSSMPMISELQPPLEPSKDIDKIILLAKPSTSISGAKRKAVTPPVEISSQPPLFVVPKKNDKEDWSCALCQVSATSERGLNDHLQGKKHKSKETALREHRIGKNYSIGLFPKKPKVTDLPEASGNLNVDQVVKPKVEFLVHNKSGEGSSLVILEKEDAKDTITPSVHDQADDMNKSEDAAPKKQKTGKKKLFPFWCATCKVGAYSEVSLEAHRVGKKHKARLLVLSTAATSAAKVDSTQTVNEAVEDVGETEVIDEVGAGVDGINPNEQEEVVTTGDN